MKNLSQSIVLATRFFLCFLENFTDDKIEMSKCRSCRCRYHMKRTYFLHGDQHFGTRFCIFFLGKKSFLASARLTAQLAKFHSIFNLFGELISDIRTKNIKIYEKKDLTNTSLQPVIYFHLYF